MKRSNKKNGSFKGGILVRLVERDYKILHEVGRWKFMLGRHILGLCDFPSASACDKRLKVLLEAKYIQRQKRLYGIPSLYTLTHKGKILSGYNKRPDNIRIDKIPHDICVLDTAVWFYQKALKQSAGYIITERELHSDHGFGVPKHYPDFVIVENDRKLAIEIEIHLKERRRFDSLIKDNYMNYDGQIWVVPKRERKISEILNANSSSYSGIQIYELEELK